MAMTPIHHQKARNKTTVFPYSHNKRFVHLKQMPTTMAYSTMSTSVSCNSQSIMQHLVLTNSV